MPKARVYELAKQFGVESKDVLDKLKQMGEFVKSASSTVEAPVVRRLTTEFVAAGSGANGQNGAESHSGRNHTVNRDIGRLGLTQSGTGQANISANRSGNAADGFGVGSVPPQAVSPLPTTLGSSSASAPGSSAQRPGTGQNTTASSIASDGTVSNTPASHGGAMPTPRSTALRSGASSVNPEAAAVVKKAAKKGPRGNRPGSTGGLPSGAPSPRAQAGAHDKMVPGQGQPKPKRPVPTPGSIQGIPRPHPGKPRPGNNPFSSRQGMNSPTPGDFSRSHPHQGQSSGQGGRPGRPGQGAGTGAPRGHGRGATAGGAGQGARPGAWGHTRPGQGGTGQNASQGLERSGGRSSGNRFGTPSQGAGTTTNTSSSGNRPGRGHGGTAGAFGRQGGKSSRARKSRRAKTRDFQELQAPIIGGVRIPVSNGQVVRLRQGASLSDLAERINVNAASLVTVLFNLGEMATATQSLDEATFQILGEEIGWDIEVVSAEEEDKELLEQFDINLDDDGYDDADLKPRPPVVTVMGHVDHGKTKLLDTIRQTQTAEREAGGITQRIGAYQVVTHLNGESRKITFLDTPGHEAFTAMRARGAELTDVAILVVAADDGVMPQTVEAINHSQAASVPIVVAVNKIDVPGANPEKVRAQLTEFGLVPEEYGGDTMFVDISAKMGTNIDRLLEAVLLTADATLDLRANPSVPARGATVEARLDKGRGAVATVLVQQGTLHVGDAIVAGTSFGRVRAMLDENADALAEATPSTPVAVLGLTTVPTAGDLFLVAPDDRTARQIAEKREASERAAQLARRRKIVSLESLKEQFAKSEIDMLNIVIKGDSSGSVEALEDSLMKIEVSDEVGIQVIHRGVGAITQNDVNLATVDKAIIIGFNVRPNRQVADLAESEGVEIKYYSVIYKAIDDIEAALKGMLKPIEEEVVTSHSEIREIFRSSKLGNIAGVMVQDGVVSRGTKARIMRDGIVTVNDLTITSLRRFKDDVNEVREGFEAGINLGSFNDLQLGDIIETFEMREKTRD